MAEVLKIALKGLDCPHCAQKIQYEVDKLPQLQEITVSVIKQELRAKKGSGYSEKETFRKIEEIVHLYEPGVEVLMDLPAENNNMNIKNKVIIGAFGITLFAVGMIWDLSLLLIGAYAVFGLPVLAKAVRNIGKGQVFDENFLMSIATIGALLLGELPEAVFVMMFYQLGEAFQSLAVDRSRKSIAELMDIRPDCANVLDKNGNFVKKAAEACKIDDIVLIKPGERIPIDGVVIKGESQLDVSALTGEAMPKYICVGEEALSGSLNLSGILTLKVTKEYGESTVVKILEMIESASDKKSKTEQFITKFARIYTPFVVVAATLLAIVPPLLTGDSFMIWIYRALTFLVISCPCALVLSVPLGYFSGIGEAGRNGILFKGSNFMYALSQVKTVVFDKTGTLTVGEFKVTTINAQPGFTEDNVLMWAALGEQRSNHPIARAVTKAYAEKVDGSNDEIYDFVELGGYGITYKTNNNTIYVGNDRLMTKEGIEFTPVAEGTSVIYIAVNKSYAGYILVADQPKQNAKETIKRLKTLGITNTVMLTGDNYKTAKKISDYIGLDHFYADLLPQNKVEQLESLLSEQTGGKVLFVGDGINDAPVLARADVGAAMGGIGSDAAIEAADMVIMNDDIEKLADAITIARNTNKIVNTSIYFALFVKAIVLALGAVGIATMWMAVFADVGVTFIAVLNSMRKKI